MTYGHWLDQAQTHLTQAAAALTRARAPTEAGDMLAALAARRDTYRALIRHIEFLVNGQPGPRLSRLSAIPILRRRGQHLTRLYAGLDAASQDRVHPGSIPTSAVARHLRNAADAAAVGADLLAGHIPIGEPPRSPEGIAIREGAGVQDAIGSIARLARALVAVDAVLPRWILNGAPSRRALVGEHLAAARWTNRHGLAEIADDLIAASAGSPPLIRLLGTVPTTNGPLPRIATAQQASDALHAVCSWLYQNPQQMSPCHIRLGAAIGLAVTPQPNTRWRLWRSAVMDTTALRGPPPNGAEARHVNRQMQIILTWAKDLQRQQTTAHAHVATEALSTLEHHTPFLADALRAGVAQVVGQGDVFVNHSTSLTTRRGMILYATPNWQRATAKHDPIASLTDTLDALAPRDPEAALRALVHRSGAALGAFPQLQARRVEASARGPAAPVPGLHGVDSNRQPRRRSR